MGSVLASILLESGHQVRVVDKLLFGGRSLLGIWSHPRFEFVGVDICDSPRMREAVEGMDAVVHLAAIVGDPACARQPDLAQSINLNASLELLQMSQKAGVSRFIFASTCSNYGRMVDPSQLVDETTELNPLSLYAETKVAVERAILQVGLAVEFVPTILRFATLYGVSSRMRFDLTVNEFTMEMLTKKHLVVFGEQFWRPYVHVRDAARAIALVLESEKAKVDGEVFNVGSTEQNFQKQHLVDLIFPLVPDAKIEYVHKKEDPRDYRVSFEKIGKKLGYSISREVQDGIREIERLIRAGVIADFGESNFRNN